MNANDGSMLAEARKSAFSNQTRQIQYKDTVSDNI
jgi:hypothetical protein